MKFSGKSWNLLILYKASTRGGFYIHLNICFIYVYFDSRFSKTEEGEDVKLIINFEQPNLKITTSINLTQIMKFGTQIVIVITL